MSILQLLQEYYERAQARAATLTENSLAKKNEFDAAQKAASEALDFLQNGEHKTKDDVYSAYQNVLQTTSIVDSARLQDIRSRNFASNARIFADKLSTKLQKHIAFLKEEFDGTTLVSTVAAELEEAYQAQLQIVPIDQSSQQVKAYLKAVCQAQARVNQSCFYAALAKFD